MKIVKKSSCVLFVVIAGFAIYIVPFSNSGLAIETEAYSHFCQDGSNNGQILTPEFRSESLTLSLIAFTNPILRSYRLSAINLRSRYLLTHTKSTAAFLIISSLLQFAAHATPNDDETMGIIAQTQNRAKLIFMTDASRSALEKTTAFYKFPPFESFNPTERRLLEKIIFCSIGDYATLGGANRSSYLKDFVTSPNSQIYFVKMDIPKTVYNGTPLGRTTSGDAIIMWTNINKASNSNYVIIGLDPKDFDSHFAEARLTTVLAKELGLFNIVDHLGNGTVKNSAIKKYSQAEREIAEFDEAIRTLEWLVKHETNMNPGTKKLIKNVGIPIESAKRQSWAAPLINFNAYTADWDRINSEAMENEFDHTVRATGETLQVQEFILGSKNDYRNSTTVGAPISELRKPQNTSSLLKSA